MDRIVIWRRRDTEMWMWELLLVNRDVEETENACAAVLVPRSLGCSLFVPPPQVSDLFMSEDNEVWLSVGHS